MALEHALDSVADLNQPTHWQTSAEYHPKTPVFEKLLKTYQKKLFNEFFLVKLSWHCRLNFFCFKNKNDKKFVTGGLRPEKTFGCVSMWTLYSSSYSRLLCMVQVLCCNYPQRMFKPWVEGGEKHANLESPITKFLEENKHINAYKQPLYRCLKNVNTCFIPIDRISVLNWYNIETSKS